MNNPEAVKADTAPEKPPVRVFAFAVGMIFLGELAIMRLLAFFPDLTVLAAAFLDGILLSCLVFPLCFFLFYKPLREKTEECNRKRQEVIRQNAFLHTVLDSLPFPFYVIDANNYQVKIINMAAGTNESGTLTCHALSHKSAEPCAESENPCPMIEVKKTGKPVTLEHIHYDQHGGRMVMEVHGYPIFDENGKVVQMIESSIDITQQKLAEDARKQLEEQFLEQKSITEKMIRFSAVPIFVLDKNHVVINWNKACEVMTGVKAHKVVGTSDHWRAFYPGQRACLADLLLDATSGALSLSDESLDASTFLHDGVRSEGWFDNVGGKKRYLVFDAVPIYNRDKEMVAVIETLQDISERKKLEEELEKLAVTDSLTGLYNRHRFNELLQQETDRARRYHTPLSLIMFDLDYFKNINDTYGHSVGDQVLQTVANIFRENVRATDWVGRWGGEEFMVLCPEATEKDAVFAAEKLRRMVESHIFETVQSITVSCGGTSFKAHDSVDAFVSRADDALYKAKDQGRNIVKII